MKAAAIALLVGVVWGTVGYAQMALPQGKVDAGRTFALETCSVCHVVSARQVAPPRFAVGPSFRAIANTEGMTGMKLQAILTTPHAIMPNLILTPQEAADVIAYILSLRST